jgi:hypothetical protein
MESDDVVRNCKIRAASVEDVHIMDISVVICAMQCVETRFCDL